MAIYLNAHGFRFSEKYWIKEDKPATVKIFELWSKCQAAMSNYKLQDGDDDGFNALMQAAGHGNVTLVKHLVKVMDKNVLNTRAADGSTLFRSILRIQKIHYKDQCNFWRRVLSKDMSKVVECVKIVIEAGADINAENEYNHKSPLEDLIDEADPEYKSLMKVYIKAGALCDGKIGNNENNLDRFASPLFREAFLDCLDWKKTKYIYIREGSPESPLSKLPLEILHLITHAYAALPDEASPENKN